MLSGIIGDGLNEADEKPATNNNSSGSNSPKPRASRKAKPPSAPVASDSSDDSDKKAKMQTQKPAATDVDTEWPRFNYIHYDPELHWCRVCDVFPRSAKDLLNHLHSAEHRQVTQEHQLVDTPWHKLPTDAELPSHKGAPLKRVPIKGLQFFISATAWYCKLCDGWIGDLHCASLHLKSKNHAHNYSNFVEQNPHWEGNWLKDREKAYARCAKVKQDADQGVIPPAPEPPCINEKSKHKKQQQQARSNKDSTSSSLFDSAKEKKRKRKSKKRKKNNNSDSSSSSSSSSDSSTENESDKAKSIRVAMRNKMRMQAQMILNEEIGGKMDTLGRLTEEDRGGWKKVSPPPPPPPPEPPKAPPAKQEESAIEDNIINQWMTVSTPSNDKHILENLKGRLKQRQEVDKEKAIEAATEQRRREREREERELKELRQREQREMEEKAREEREREQRDREEREQIKERERNRRKRRSESRSPDARFGRARSRSRSVGRSKYRRGGGPRSPPDRFYREPSRRSPDKPPKPAKRHYGGDDDEETHFDKHSSESMRQSRGKKSSSSHSSSSSSRKLPFIGRMPLFKKRTDGSDDKEIKKEDYEIRLSKFEPGNTARAFIPEPGVVHITKLASQPDPIPQMLRINAENPPPPPKIIPEPPHISNVPPPPPRINTIATVEEVEVQDMELDEAAPPLPPGVPVNEAKPLAKPAGNHLPRDFQDALNIIFPGDQRPEHLAALQADPSLMLQYQYNMGYGMMPYSGIPQMQYDYSGGTQDDLMKDESGEAATGTATDKPTTDNDQIDDKEDLAMLGIDAEDMAAQTF